MQVNNYFAFVAQKQQNPALVNAKNTTFHKYIDLYQRRMSWQKKRFVNYRNKQESKIL